MKKFYISIFAVVFLLSSFLSQGQTIYNSITSNPGGLTLDDAAYWVGTQPPNPCTNCIINIFSDVAMVQNGQSSDPTHNCGGCTYLNDVVINGTLSKINIYGNTNLSVNTYLQLFGVTVTLGNNPTDVETFFVNDQVDLDATSSVRLANGFSLINTNNDAGNIIVGPHSDFGHPTDKSAGLYQILAAPVFTYSYSMILTSLGYGYADPARFNSAGYTINCTPTPGPTQCASGIVYGPAATTLDGTFGIIFTPAAVLPVELVLFIASKNADGSVKLTWATSQEVNAGYFDVERSSDQTGWNKIGSVKAKGNSSTTTNYNFTDKAPLIDAGYYRLKMVDLDSKFKYSKTVSVTTDEVNRPLVIYNNPFNDMIRMKVNVSRAQNLTMTVADMQGKTYLSTSYPAKLGDNFVTLPSNPGGSGMYILRINGDSYNQTVKLVKQ